jgi:hypothetical protein
MAYRYINGKLHKTEKVYSGTCTKCGHQTGCGSKVSEVLAGTPLNKTVALYCYDCTGNNWGTSFRLYREAQAS